MLLFPSPQLSEFKRLLTDGDNSRAGPGPCAVYFSRLLVLLLFKVKGQNRNVIAMIHRTLFSILKQEKEKPLPKDVGYPRWHRWGQT